MDKIFAIENGALYVDRNGWHTCHIADGRMIVGKAVKGFTPKERFNAYEINAKCGKNFGRPTADRKPPGQSPDTLGGYDEPGVQLKGETGVRLNGKKGKQT